MATEPSAATEQPPDAGAPGRWNATTPPFDVLWHFRQDDVTKEQITALLEEKNIKSLTDLKQRICLLGSDCIRVKCGGELIDTINAALRRTQSKPTELLGGRLKYDTSCIDATSLSCYSSKAVAFKQSRPFEPRQIPNFTLVLGPSGSGKTMFCIQYLPLQVFPEATSMKDIFRVHVKASTLLGDYNETKPILNLSELLVNHVQGAAGSLLPMYYACDVPPIDLFLYVVIDEAGSTGYKRFFETACEIEKIVAALRDMSKYSFTKGVHVTVTGTGLETPRPKTSIPPLKLLSFA
jgi:hypothetical protein